MKRPYGSAARKVKRPSSIIVRMLDHAGPNVRDYERSRAFYERAL